MKIAFFSNSYLPYLSGVTVSIQTLKQGLEKLGHTVFVVCPKYPTGPQAYRPMGIFCLPSIPAPYPGYRLVWPYSYKFFKKLKDEKIDLIHGHQPFGVGLAALLLARRLKVPFVYSFHTLFSRYIHNIPFLPKRLSKFLISGYLTWFCNQADTVVVSTKMVKRYLLACGVKTRIEVIPTGAKGREAEYQNIRKAEIRKEKILLYTGRLSKEKNIPFLLEAFPAIEKQEPSIKFILVGGGPMEEEVRQMAAKISPKIIVVGQKGRKELLEYYCGADIFIYASRTETQGLVLTEAKACGLPVVAVFGGGIADVVRNGIDGYLVPPSQAKFVEHVVRLLKDDALRQAMGAKGASDAAERFSPASVAKQFETLYNCLIS